MNEKLAEVFKGQLKRMIELYQKHFDEVNQEMQDMLGMSIMSRVLDLIDLGHKTEANQMLAAAGYMQVP